MSNDQTWITIRVTDAKELQSLVTEAVSARMDELLKGQLSERQLSRTELTGIAVELIADMVPELPEVET